MPRLNRHPERSVDGEVEGDDQRAHDEREQDDPEER
jgi:hypothetical protein